MSRSTRLRQIAAEQPAAAEPGTGVAARARASRIQNLDRAVGQALRDDHSPLQLARLLLELVRATEVNSEIGSNARLLLAETLLRQSPSRGAAWQSARLAKEARQTAPSGLARARAWGVSALAYSALGHFRSARDAYYRALREDPGNAIYAHNLGHLLDVRLGEPQAGLPWLKKAYGLLPDEPEVAASYAYTLLACNEAEHALEVLSAALGSRNAARLHIDEWLARASRNPG
jgi:predicted Zn-dependent protease